MNKRMKWKYAGVSLDGREAGGTCITEDLLKISGDRGWELVTIYNDVAYFKCPKENYGEEEAVKEAHSEEDTNKPQRPSTAGQLYSRAYE
jgi:hypothetical protein